MKIVGIALILAFALVPGAIAMGKVIIHAYPEANCDGRPTLTVEGVGECIDDKLEDDDSHHRWKVSGNTVTMVYFPASGCAEGTHDKEDTSILGRCYPDREKNNAFRYELEAPSTPDMSRVVMLELKINNINFTAFEMHHVVHGGLNNTIMNKFAAYFAVVPSNVHVLHFFRGDSLESLKVSLYIDMQNTTHKIEDIGNMVNFVQGGGAKDDLSEAIRHVHEISKVHKNREPLTVDYIDLVTHTPEPEPESKPTSHETARGTTKTTRPSTSTTKQAPKTTRSHMTSQKVPDMDEVSDMVSQGESGSEHEMEEKHKNGARYRRKSQSKSQWYRRRKVSKKVIVLSGPTAENKKGTIMVDNCPYWKKLLGLEGDCVTNQRMTENPSSRRLTEIFV